MLAVLVSRTRQLLKVRNMSLEIIYRVLNYTDKEKYREIRLECLKNYPQNFGTLYEDEINSNSLKFDRVISENQETDFLFGAFKEKKLLGICGNIQEDRVKTKHISEISQLYVSPEFSKNGIATKLLNLTIEKVFTNKIIEQIILGVVESNKQAIKLYEKSGFTKYGILENYYKHGTTYEAMLFMVLKRK
jgi:ribosomal protein S18 acetylase RimI-like enzyme